MLTAPRAVAAVVVAGLLASACTSTGAGPDGATTGSASPTVSTGPQEAHLDLSALAVPRADVCGLLAADDVEQALGGPLAGTDHYGNGDTAEVAPGRVDVVHEFGCVYLGKDGTAARTWIFARPVLPQEARELVRRARRGRDCAFPASVRFGTPSLTSVCEVEGAPTEGPLVRARLEGLYGDAWMGCEVSEPTAEPTAQPTAQDGRADVVQRAEQWCTEVVTAISTSA